MSAAPGAATAPLSVAQEGLLFASLLAPRRISYNETISFRKDGPFDAGAMRRAFNEIIRRHAAWRTTFDTVDGEPSQMIHAPEEHPLPLVDLSHLDLEAAERQAVRMVSEASRVPYDIRRGPLIRPRLVRFPGEHHRLYLAMHHLIFDGVSVYRVVLHELIALYDAFRAGEPSPLPEPAATYADYARWEQEWIDSRRAEKRMRHWREHLTDLPELSLPSDRPRPPEPRFRGGVLSLELSKQQADRMRAVGQASGASLFQALAAAWSILLARYSGQEDIVFATPADMRKRAEFESVVGYSLSPVVLRIDVTGDPTFQTIVERVRNELLDGLDNVVPFERLVREVVPGGASSGNPIYGTMIVMEPATAAPDTSWSIHQMEGEIGEAVGATKLDFELELDERPEGHLAGRLIYDRDLFDAETVRRMADHWIRIVDAVAAEPDLPLSRVPVLTPEDEQQQLVEWNATSVERPAESVHELVAATAARWPDAPAVTAGEQTISYAELEARAETVAGRLRAAGVRAGEVVALCAEPSVQLIAGALGVLKSGAAYELLDPSSQGTPGLLSACEPAAVLAAPGGLAEVSAEVIELETEQAVGALPLPLTPSSRAAGEEAGDLCCLQPVVGADGRFLLAETPHTAAVNCAVALSTDMGIDRSDSILVLASQLWADSVAQLWPALTQGARVVLAPAELETDGRKLGRLISRQRVAFMRAPAGIWQQLVDSGLRSSRSLRVLVSDGRLSQELAEGLLARCPVVWNSYGVPESGGYSAVGRVEASAGPVNTGRPVANTRVYVVDPHGRPLPPGVEGDLLIAGDGLAAGYRGAPEAAASAWATGPGGEERVFATGTRARWLPGGLLDLVD